MSRAGAIITVVAVLLMASVGTGLALSYFSTTTSRDNTIPYDGITLDVIDSNNMSLNAPIPVARPSVQMTEDRLYHIHGGCDFTYKLKVNCPDTVYLQSWCNLSHAESWAIIESITLKFTDSNGEHAVDFMSNGPTLSTSSIPSEALLLSAGTYQFKVSIQYKDITLDLEGGTQEFMNLSGSSITFSASMTEPVPGVVNPWVDPVGS